MVFDHQIEGVGEIDAEDLLNMLDADNVHDVGQDEIGFSCFYTAGHAHGDQNPSAHINRDSLLWRCKGCERAGNVAELVKIALPDHASYPEALAWLREHFGEISWKPKGGSLGADLEARLAKARFMPPQPRLPDEKATIWPQGIFYLDWTSDHPAAVYMRGRGFEPSILSMWDVGYDEWTRRVTIPIRDERGALVGFKGRAIDDSTPKYLLLGDTATRTPRYGTGYGFDMYDTTSVLFGLDRARRDGGGVLVLCEGELDAIACHAAGITYAVASGTKSVSEKQLWLLRAHADTLVIFYDSDLAGRQAVFGHKDPDGRWFPGLAEKVFLYFRRVLVVDDHEGDPASMAPEQVRRLATGARHWMDRRIPSTSLV